VLRAGYPEFAKLLERLSPDYRAFVIDAFTVSHAPYSRKGLDLFCGTFPPDECEGVKSAVGKDLDEYPQLYYDNRFGLSYNFPETVAQLGLSPPDLEDLAKVVELLYKSNISLLDALFGEVVDAIDQSGLLEESLIVFTADHGEVLYRENALCKWTHGHALAPKVLNVPLLIRAPSLGVVSGRYERVTRSIDVFPTTAALADVPLPEDVTVAGADPAPANSAQWLSLGLRTADFLCGPASDSGVFMLCVVPRSLLLD